MHNSGHHYYAAPGVRFVPIQTPAPVLESVAVTRTDADDLATAAFLRALGRADRPVHEVPARPDVALAA